MVNTYIPIFRGLDAGGGRKLQTHICARTHARTHTHTHTHTHTGQLKYPSLRACAPRVNNYYVHKVGEASKQSTISGWGKHDVHISIPFTRDTTHACACSARTQIRKLCGIVKCSEHWLSKLRLCQRTLAFCLISSGVFQVAHSPPLAF